MIVFTARSPRTIKGVQAGTVVDVSYGWTSTVLIDAGHTTRLPKNPKDEDIAKMVKTGKFHRQTPELIA